MDHNSYSSLIKKDDEFATLEPYVDSVHHFQDFKNEISVKNNYTKPVNFNFEKHVKSFNGKKTSMNTRKSQNYMQWPKGGPGITGTGRHEVHELQTAAVKSLEIKSKKRLKKLFSNQDVFYDKKKLIINSKRFLNPKKIIRFLLTNTTSKLKGKKRNIILKLISTFPEENKKYLGTTCKELLGKE